jgi:hypothetical protein
MVRIHGGYSAFPGTVFSSAPTRLQPEITAQIPQQLGILGFFAQYPGFSVFWARLIQALLNSTKYADAMCPLPLSILGKSHPMCCAPRKLPLGVRQQTVSKPAGVRVHPLLRYPARGHDRPC